MWFQNHNLIFCSLDTSKYSPANYTPNISRNLNSTSYGSAADSAAYRSRPSTHSTAPSTTNLSRTTSASHKTLYNSPAAARVSVSSNDSFSNGPSSLAPTNPYRGISKCSTIERSSGIKPYYSSTLYASSTHDNRRSRSDRGSSSTLPDVKIESGPTTRTNMVHPTSSHIRSRSTYSRGNTVSMLTQQAKERADREEKDRDYKEWMQREKDRETELGLETLHPTFSTNTSPSSAQNEFRRSAAPTTPSSASASSSSSSSYLTSSYRSNRFSSASRVPATATPSSTSSPLDDVISTSYSGVASTPPPAYHQLSTSTSTLLRNRREKLESEEENRKSMTPQPQYGTIPLPPPPPPPPSSNGPYLPRSVSAAVLSSSSLKPTAKVYPFDEVRDKVCVVEPGYTGLRNIGNTCFMNAVLQMLVNNVELREFFLQDHYKMEINTSNPLGSEGRLANAFADFMQQMWSGRQKAIEPIQIKNIVAEKASQFANFAQHDAHEFLSFLLDGLHEDVNRVKTKPLTNTVESHGRHDQDVSDEAWRNHILRNDSIFVDLFHGQLKSHVQCPKCDRVSITFDPFVYLPVPFPKRKKSTSLVFWPLENQAKPFKMTVSYSTEGTVADLLSAVSEAVKVPSRNLRACEALIHRFDKIYTNDMKVSDIISPDYLFVFQLHDESECNEEVVVLNVVQRELYRSGLKYACHECGTSQVKLKSCEECYDAVYCSKACQVANWSTGGHREVCSKRLSSESVGFPLIVSLPRSQLTYQHLYRVLEAKSRHTVTLFQQPQYENGDGDSDSLSTSSAGSKKKNGVGAPPTFLQAPGDVTIVSSATPRRRSVLAEPRSRNQKMFEIRKLITQNDSFGAHDIGDDEACQALETGTYVSINWINQRNGKPYITIGNRTDIDVNVEKSKQMSSNSTGSVSNNCDTNPHLTQMLGLFSETERLKPEESWYCSTCKEHVEATKRLQLYRLPPVLIIQLKRFVYTAFTHQSAMHRRSKDERTVEYPLESLDMSPFLAETAPNRNSTMYDLTGVVCHNGSSYFGHYISMGRLADFDSAKTKIEWRQFDDSMVSRQSAGNIQTDDAYLLFYKQRDPSVTRSIFKRHYSCDPGQSASSEVKI
uniref:ubiquitinyl hydrolase 1 n=1 Tax=Caenorhabditis japonica TaxID=281687 RepID=A0A8R1HZH3_CAEJA